MSKQATYYVHTHTHTQPNVCLMMTTLQLDTSGGKSFQWEFQSTITFILKGQFSYILPLVLHFEECLEHYSFFIYFCSIPALRKKFLQYYVSSLWVKSTESGAKWPGFKFCLLHIQAVKPGTHFLVPWFPHL